MPRGATPTSAPSPVTPPTVCGATSSWSRCAETSLVERRVERHRGHQCVARALAAEDLAPQGVGVLGEDVGRLSRLDDPSAFGELGVELTRAPPRPPPQHPPPPPPP